MAFASLLDPEPDLHDKYSELAEAPPVTEEKGITEVEECETLTRKVQELEQALGRASREVIY